MGTTIVRAGQSSKALLARCVPDCQFHLVLVDLQVLHFEVDADCGLNVFVKSVVREAQEHT